MVQSLEAAVYERTESKPKWAPAVQANPDGGIQFAACNFASCPNHRDKFRFMIQPAI